MAVSPKGGPKLRADKESMMNIKPVITPRPTNPVAAQRKQRKTSK